MEQFRAFNAAWTLQRVSCCREKGGFVRTLSNQARSAPASESEYFLSFENFFADTIVYIYQSKSNHLTPSLRMRGAG